jgi:hypothetical protein
MKVSTALASRSLSIATERQCRADAVASKVAVSLAGAGQAAPQSAIADDQTPIDRRDLAAQTGHRADRIGRLAIDGVLERDNGQIIALGYHAAKHAIGLEAERAVSCGAGGRRLMLRLR